SVALIDSGRAAVGAERPLLRKLSVVVESGHVTVQVTIDADGEYVGEASGQDSVGVRMRLAAQAALRALNRYMGSERVHLEDIAVVEFAEDKGVVAALTLPGAEGDSSALGIALVQTDWVDAAARAVLDAGNRWMAKV